MSDVTNQDVNDALDSLRVTALRVKADRDLLLLAAKNFCTALIEEAPSISVSLGIAEKFMELRAAIIKAEQ